MDPNLKSIRERAYELWESEGRPAGREQHHWEQASAELAEVKQEAAEPVPVKRPRATKKPDVTAASMGAGIDDQAAPKPEGAGIGKKRSSKKI